MPLAKEKPSLAWSCERAGVALPRAQGDSRPHTAAYDAEAHGRLYIRLKALEARSEKIYGHLPLGVAVLLGYTVGAFVKMTQFAMLHDICHGSAGDWVRPWFNRVCCFHLLSLPSMGDLAA